MLQIGTGERHPLSDPDSGSEFHELFDRLYVRLVRALFLMTGDALMADELAQETFVRVFERWDRIKGMDSPDGYVFRVGMNLHRSRLRKVRRHGVEFAERFATDPVAIAEARDEIERALEALTPREREVMVLVAWLGMETTEVADVLGVKPSTVRVLVARARTKIKVELSEHD
jgi:RNA polymerase sigma-70 factor (ECF subfamily)